MTYSSYRNQSYSDIMRIIKYHGNKRPYVRFVIDKTRNNRGEYTGGWSVKVD